MDRQGLAKDRPRLDWHRSAKDGSGKDRPSTAPWHQFAGIFAASSPLSHTCLPIQLLEITERPCDFGFYIRAPLSLMRHI